MWGDIFGENVSVDYWPGDPDVEKEQNPAAYSEKCKNKLQIIKDLTRSGNVVVSRYFLRFLCEFQVLRHGEMFVYIWGIGGSSIYIRKLYRRTYIFLEEGHLPLRIIFGAMPDGSAASEKRYQAQRRFFHA